ncbi:MAG TPA: transcriptional repressor LexA [Rhodanobacteraceae bacterium]|nr:transcriptional repressor LexA [Rhodanobacteraceae bacterium]
MRSRRFRITSPAGSGRKARRSRPRTCASCARCSRDLRDPRARDNFSRWRERRKSRLRGEADIRTLVRMSPERLTANQQRVLDCIRRHFDRHGRTPTLREISEDLGLSSHSSAQDYVEALVRKGALERLPHHRGLRLPDRSRSWASAATQLPLVGRVAAGSPILAAENVEAHHDVDPGLFRPRADYLLRVVGLSMRDAGILDGDLIAVHKTQTAEHGRIVVARIDEEVTVKELDRRGGRVRLLPANPDFAPIDIDPDRHAFAIEGLYVGLIRSASPFRQG